MNALKVFCFIGVAALMCSFGLFAQDETYTSAATGMKFILIHPGSMIVGDYHPECPNVNDPGPTSEQGTSANPSAAPVEPSPQTNSAPPPSGSTIATPPPTGRGGRGGIRMRYTAAQRELCLQLSAQDSSPGFNVTINKPYYIGKYEVTQGEWKKVMGTNPSHFQGDKVSDDADQHPVDSVTWDDAHRFIAALNKAEKTHAYRLPSESEWEYAARAGANEETPWNEIGDYAWYAQNMPGGRGPGGPGRPGAAGPGPSTAGAGSPQVLMPEQPQSQTALPPKATTHEVGQKKPNAWGLYDMVGNVWEWCQDFYNYKMFPDAVSPKKGDVHVIRGGSFNEDQIGANFLEHAGGPADGWDVGFRVVRDVK